MKGELISTQVATAIQWIDATDMSVKVPIHNSPKRGHPLDVSACNQGRLGLPLKQVYSEHQEDWRHSQTTVAVGRPGKVGLGAGSPPDGPFPLGPAWLVACWGTNEGATILGEG